MSKEEILVVRKNGPLKGEVYISGAKNSALPILAASLLASEEVILDEVPKLKDIEVMVEILRSLNAKVQYITDTSLRIDSSNVDKFETPFELMDKMRASFIVMGPLLAKFGHAVTKAPGGCNIGKRPIDLHLKGFEALGAKTTMNHEEISSKTKNGLTGNVIYLDFPSVIIAAPIFLSSSTCINLFSKTVSTTDDSPLHTVINAIN